MVSFQVVAWGLAGLTVGLAAFATWLAGRRGVRRQATAGVWLLVLAHPGFWMSPDPVDGGVGLAKNALMFTILAVVIGGWLAYRPVRPETDDAADSRSPRP